MGKGEGKKKKKKERKPWCFYCDRVFEDEAVLVQHQKARHWKCSECHKKMASAGGLISHLEGVHHVVLQKIPNAKIGRDNVNQNEIYGMGGIPEEYLDWHPDDHEPDPAEPAAKRQKLADPNAAAAAAPAAGAVPELPPGWTMHHDPQGRPYYANAATGTSTWTPPAPVAQAAGAPADNPAIGPAARPDPAAAGQPTPAYGFAPTNPYAQGFPGGVPQPYAMGYPGMPGYGVPGGFPPGGYGVPQGMMAGGPMPGQPQFAAGPPQTHAGAPQFSGGPGGVPERGFP